jgi:hypothetical protein
MASKVLNLEWVYNGHLNIDDDVLASDDEEVPGRLDHYLDILQIPNGYVGYAFVEKIHGESGFAERNAFHSN